MRLIWKVRQEPHNYTITAWSALTLSHSYIQFLRNTSHVKSKHFVQPSTYRIIIINRFNNSNNNVAKNKRTIWIRTACMVPINSVWRKPWTICIPVIILPLPCDWCEKIILQRWENYGVCHDWYEKTPQRHIYKLLNKIQCVSDRDREDSAGISCETSRGISAEPVNWTTYLFRVTFVLVKKLNLYWYTCFVLCMNPDSKKRSLAKGYISKRSWYFWCNVWTNTALLSFPNLYRSGFIKT